MEVGCPGTWRLGLPTPNPGSKSNPKACPTRNQATSPARHTQPQLRHPLHRTRSSVEIITVKNNNNNNDNNNNNNNNNNNRGVVKTQLMYPVGNWSDSLNNMEQGNKNEREGRVGWEKTLKHSKN